MLLENTSYRIHIRETDGAIDSFCLKRNGVELIQEVRLASAYRLCVPTEDMLCNYIESGEQTVSDIIQEENTVSVSIHGMNSPKGWLAIDLTYSISLEEDTVRFTSKLTNHTQYPVTEFWFPRIGGITAFDEKREAMLTTPEYLNCQEVNLVRNFPGNRGLGAEAAEVAKSYPSAMPMPWWDIYDKASDTGIYLGYHDTTLRLSSWHCYLHPDKSGRADSMMKKEDACGEAVGIVFSHVRYPYIKDGETLESGEFLLRTHNGDWHTGSLFYRAWFLQNFPIDKTNSWLRKKSAWFTSIIYQPEDKVIADYKTYDAWCKDAEKYGVTCHELIGWDKGGLERDYPEYVPEEKLGGVEGFRELMASIAARKARSLVFVNYNILDCSTEWYKKELYQYTHQDSFGHTPNWMCWGESTLLARQSLTARRHVLSSVLPPMEEILEKHFVTIAESGASGLQIDKVCVGSTLDLNPLNTEKPDVALCEGLVQAIGRTLQKCREKNPEFCIASEMSQDRLIPYVDVGYRNAELYTISPLHYVFPEWTACQHVSAPYDYQGVNSAVMTGAVICAEPGTYQNSMDLPHWRKLSCYISEVEKIRADLADVIFTGVYCDTLLASASLVDPQEAPEEPIAREIRGEVMIPGGAAASKPSCGKLQYRTHKTWDESKLAIVVANGSEEELRYQFAFENSDQWKKFSLYRPFCEPIEIHRTDILTIKDTGLHIILAEK